MHEDRKESLTEITKETKKDILEKKKLCDPCVLCERKIEVNVSGIRVYSNAISGFVISYEY